MMKNNFYIYIHVKPYNGEIFYVGKGKDKRVYDKLSRSNFWEKVVNKHGLDIFILENNLTEQEAFELEKKYIKRVGRRYLKTGTLVNLSDGGEGNAGYKHSEEHKKKISEALTGKKRSKLSEETKKKISEAQTGRILSEEHKKKISEASKGKKRSKRSEETKKKISEKLTGTKLSEETKKKMSEAAKKAWVKRKLNKNIENK